MSHATQVADRSPSDPVSYAGSRTIHDADAHMVEPDGYYEAYADPAWRDRLSELPNGSRGRQLDGSIQRILDAQRTPDRTAAEAAEVMVHKNLDAVGAFVAEDRVRALDHMGFQSQLIFTSSFLRLLTVLDQGTDRELSLAATAAHNRGVAEFCAADDRLYSTAWVPLGNIDDAVSVASGAIADGAGALMLPSLCPRDHGPSHIGFDPLWAMAEESGTPIVLHVGGGRPMNETYKINGLPTVRDFHGGDGNFTSVSFMAIPEAPMQTVATLIFDGGLDRFPELRIGVIEQGAYWVPGWMRSMDSAAGAFNRNEDRLRSLSLSPSEFVQRQVRVTPYPHEDAGWIIDQVGPDVCMFSSDYPHIEGGRHPLKRFDASLGNTADDAVAKFYADNYIDMMGW